MNKYERWYKLSEMLTDIKAQEAKARREICDEIFNGKTGEFKETLEFDDYDITASSGVSRNIDKDLLEDHWHELSPTEQACVRHVPLINLKPYRNLPEDSLLHECVVEKPAMPRLSLKVKL